MNRFSSLVKYAGVFLVLFIAASCNKSDNGTNINPRGTAPSWGPSMHKEMITVIEQLDSFHVPALQSLPAVNARGQLTIFDAEKKVALLNGLNPNLVTTDTFSIIIPVAGSTITARVYKPRTGSGPFPAIIYYHGGGFTIGDAKMYDATTRSLAEQTGAIVISVNYRTGPEYKFPTAHNDAYTAYRYVIENAASLGVNAYKIAVCGEGAGANLACNVSMAARNDTIRMPVYQLLMYPITEVTLNTASYSQYASAEPLSKLLSSWMITNYLSSQKDTADTRISLASAKMQGLPPTTIINAEIDPLRDDGLLLENAMKAAGVSVTRRIFDGVTHDFYGMSIVLPEARAAQGVGVAALRTAFQ